MRQAWGGLVTHRLGVKDGENRFVNQQIGAGLSLQHSFTAQTVVTLAQPCGLSFSERVCVTRNEQEYEIAVMETSMGTSTSQVEAPTLNNTAAMLQPASPLHAPVDASCALHDRCDRRRC